MLARIAPGFILRRGGGLASSSVSTRVPPGGRSSIPRRAAFATRASGGDKKAKGKDKAKKKETLKAAPPQPKADPAKAVVNEEDRAPKAAVKVDSFDQFDRVPKRPPRKSSFANPKQKAIDAKKAAERAEKEAAEAKAAEAKAKQTPEEAAAEHAAAMEADAKAREEAKAAQDAARAAWEANQPDPEMERFHEHQKTAVKLAHADECRTLIDQGRYGVLSTFDAKLGGEYPTGAVVGFASDDAGCPIFALSSMSGHTRDLKACGRCSLTVTQKGFQGSTEGFQSAADARVTLVGDMEAIEDDDGVAAARETYLAKHPDAFWVDFGDFSWHRMTATKGARLIGGFARAGGVDGDAYASATQDPVAQYSTPIATHMNVDHEKDLLDLVGHFVKLTVDKCRIESVDALGLNLLVMRRGEKFKVRLPFAEEARDRPSVKKVLVAMTKEASEAMKMKERWNAYGDIKDDPMGNKARAAAMAAQGEGGQQPGAGGGAAPGPK